MTVVKPDACPVRCASMVPAWILKVSAEQEQNHVVGLGKEGFDLVEGNGGFAGAEG